MAGQPRSAGRLSAVSPAGSRPGAAGFDESPNSTAPQAANLRYSRLPVGVTAAAQDLPVRMGSAVAVIIGYYRLKKLFL